MFARGKGRLRSKARLTAAMGFFLASWCAPKAAFAWYFPEHAELSRLALQDFAPPEVQRALEQAVNDARNQGLAICPGVVVPFNRVNLVMDDVAECVSYGALTALAGDHSVNTAELRRLVGEKSHRSWPMIDIESARLYTGAAVVTWQKYLSDAEPDELEVWLGPRKRVDEDLHVGRDMGRKSWISSLDVELTALDSGYITRAAGSNAHFHTTADPKRILSNILAGDIDNALAQTLVHHARSLQLALLAARTTDTGAKQQLRAEALLEHVFAVHFLEDGYAAGHVATGPETTDSVQRKQRHDYFNRQGLELTHALDKSRCDQDESPPRLDVAGPKCWMAHGDGYATMADRWAVGVAVARLQAVFALALLDTANALTNDKAKGTAACARFRSVLALHESNPNSSLHHKVNSDVCSELQTDLSNLAQLPIAPPRSAGGPALQLFASESQWLGSPLPLDGPTEAAGTPSVPPPAAIWRILLADWPSSTAKPYTLEGADSVGGGLSYQVTTGIGLSCVGDFACHEASEALVWATGGLAFRTTGILPWCRELALAEINFGTQFGVLLSNPRGTQYQTTAIGEARIPLSTILVGAVGWFWNTRYPLKLISHRVALGLFGARGFWQTNDGRFEWHGWDLEVLDVRLNTPTERNPAVKSAPADSEFRLHLGWTNPTAPVGEAFGGQGYFTVNAEFVAGYYGYF